MALPNSGGLQPPDSYAYARSCKQSMYCTLTTVQYTTRQHYDNVTWQSYYHHKMS